MLEEKFFDTGELRLNYAVGPEKGVPVVMLPGFFGRWEFYVPVLSQIASRTWPMALDLRGHGKSGRVAGKYRLLDYALDTAKFIQNVPDKPVVVLGYGEGGMLALWLAAHLPEKVKGAIIGDAPLSIERYISLVNTETFRSYASQLRALAGSTLHPAELHSILSEMIYPFTGNLQGKRFSDYAKEIQDETILWDAAQDIKDLDPDVLAYHAEGKFADYFAGFDLEAAVRNTFCPLLLIQGNPLRGALMQAADLEDAARIFPQGRVKLLSFKDTGHEIGFIGKWKLRSLLKAITDFARSVA